MKKSALFLFSSVLLAGCFWENEETLYPDSALCDTIAVSYMQDIVPIISNNCYTCHSNINAPDFALGITFEDYENVFNASGLIVGAINHSEGFPQMPKNRDKLDLCLINIFEAWVNQGSLNN